MDRKKEALRIIEQALKELESSKGSVLSAVQKLHRASEIVDKEDVKIWCAIQLGNREYTHPLSEFLEFLVKQPDPKSKAYENGNKRDGSLYFSSIRFIFF